MGGVPFRLEILPIQSDTYKLTKFQFFFFNVFF